MKLLITVFLLSFAGLKQHSGNEIQYHIDQSKSKLNWTGYYLFSFGEHFGSIDIQEGSLTTKDGQLTGGKVTINMKSIDTLDKGFEGKDDLAEHLKGSDFFDSEKYTTSVLEITGTKPIADAQPNQPNVDITGMLTLKGIRQAITFPAEVNIQDKQLIAKARFKIDRTKWDVKYNSGKYFSDIGDGAISDAIGLSFDITATPKNQ
jgi:polyisoprenoid-binding protein YceI